MIDKKEFNRAGILVLFFLILAIWWGWKEYHTAPISKATEETIAVVNVVPVVEKKVRIEKKYIGYVTPINDVNVQPYINGFISQVLVKGGQKVKIGDKLLEIEQSEYKAALEEAKASVSKAEADFNYADNYYKRIQKAGLKAVSQTEMDNAKAAYLSSKAALLQAQAAMVQAEVNLGYTVINSTIDGIVGNVALTVGDYVSPQNQLLSIVQTNPMRVVFSISDKDYLEENAKDRMFDKEQIRLKLVDGSMYEYTGEFKYVDNKIDRSTNSVAVYADFENPKQKLIDKAYVSVLIEKEYIGVPVSKDLITLQPNGSFLYVAEGDVVKKHTVKILSEYGNNYILANNFSPDMKIVSDRITLRGQEQKMKIVEVANVTAEEN